MWVCRERVEGGWLYEVYRTEVNCEVNWLGTNYMRGRGWRPDAPFVSDDDDAILRRRGFVRLLERRDGGPTPADLEQRELEDLPKAPVGHVRRAIERVRRVLHDLREAAGMVVYRRLA